MRARILASAVSVIALAAPPPGLAQVQDAGIALPAAFNGPPPPALPSTIARDAEGRVTVRAIRLTSPLRLDGRLDEAVYESVQPLSDFIQMEPDGGQPATEKTEIWILFDQSNVYVAVRAWESQPERQIANEMRRDSNNILMGGDHVGFSFDTFYDRRNAAQFTVNALGGRFDGQSSNERQYNGDWNPIWDVAVGRFEQGWTVESVIPFKSLRYRPGRVQVWGFNARRSNKWKNEISYLVRIPPAFGLGRGSFAASLFASLVGLEAPAGSKNLEIKPYAIGDLTSDIVAAPPISNRFGRDAGLDVKYGITQNLTSDFTYNTDFAQVEADEQQINLTRFNLFFPEKREFFLENQGTFDVGGVRAGAGGQMGQGGGNSPILFYSRRVGLTQFGRALRPVPIQAGGRLTGRVGGFSLGLIDIQSDDEPSAGAPATNFAVVRVKRDFLRRSSIGAIVANRSVAQNRAGSNQTYGLDATLAFFQNLYLNTYWAKTQTDGLEGDDVSYRAHLEYAGDRYGLQLERLTVGANFNPEVGFVRRVDMNQSWAQLRFSPRPRASKVIRKLFWTGTINYIENGGGLLETRETDGEFAVEFQNSDRFNVGIADTFDLLEQPFAIDPRVRIPAGGYNFSTAQIGYNFGQQRRFSGNVLAERGSFYEGHRTAIGFSRPRLNLTPRVSAEPSLSINWIDLPFGSFTTKLAGTRMTYTLTPLMFASALLQYNSSTNRVSTNVRLRWEYRPGSELFVVYNDERNSLTRGFPDLQNRAFIVKINRLFRF